MSSQRSNKGKALAIDNTPEVPDDIYYHGEQDEFDVFAEVESPGEPEIEKETDFADWEEEAPSDPRFEKVFHKQRSELLRKEDELKKIHEVVSRKKELQIAKNAEKQRLHEINVDLKEETSYFKLEQNGMKQGEL